MTEVALGSVLFAAMVVGLAALVMAARAVLLPARDVTITITGRR